MAGVFALSFLGRCRCFICCDFVLLFVLCCDFGWLWKDGNPMGAVWWGGAYIACSAERNRFKLHIISLHILLLPSREPALRPKPHLERYRSPPSEIPRQDETVLQ